ncbi:MAG: high-potential iron-sulfur protein [Bdellovibrionaceae bacterium]|nr:high-potential iron-sulfur protein [Pseudobdellovibrionaceae bacterium]MBX3034718.1 high-potential iron-sulfur protein [Pseudobdellovibrionaceae bacterium]
MSDSSCNRRRFLAQAGQYSALLIAGPLFLRFFSSEASAQERRRGGGGSAAGGPAELAWPFVVPGKDAAAAVNYVEDKSKMTKKELMTDRQGVKYADQHCHNCGFYKKVGTKDGKEAGTCTIFAQKLVVGAGWCGSWNKKA